MDESIQHPDRGLAFFSGNGELIQYLPEGERAAGVFFEKLEKVDRGNRHKKAQGSRFKVQGLRSKDP
jgi:hypothetical protein